jgi:alpha-L-fucosidase
MHIESGPFEPTLEALRQFQCPTWFRDAKFGIWSHWGPQSVTAHGDWYARNMYIQGHSQYLYHLRTYGHPSEFGYKDLLPLWKAERFDPDGLMGLYIEAGAKYFISQAAHHDNFHNWDSDHHRWNALNVGPQKNIVGLWRDAARAHGLRFGLSEHIGGSFAWWVVNKGADATGPWAGIPYDGTDPDFEDLYLPNRDAKPWPQEWYTSDPRWRKLWFTYIKELIDKYQPDLLYSDGPVPFGEVGLRALAHLYNSSARLHGGVNEAIHTEKDRKITDPGVGLLDIERSQLPEIAPVPWQTDTCLGGWFYNAQTPYKTAKQVAEILVDVVSKNGNLLLNVPQRSDGTIDRECQFTLAELARWIAVNGDGIYGTRPWTHAIEGPSAVTIDGFKEDAVDWSERDFRFTAKDGAVYAFQLKWPDRGITTIESLALGSAAPVESVQLLGHDRPLSFSQTEQGLAIRLPEEKPGDFAHCFRIAFDA